MSRLARPGDRLRLLVLVGCALAMLTAAGARTSLARFTGQASGAGGIAAGYWVYYLHNSPTPPVGNTSAVANLSATQTAPTAATLYNYDTNCDTRPGRGLTRTVTVPGLLTTCYYVDWRLPLEPSAVRLSTLTVDVWAATNTNAANRTGVLILYLRDFNPTSGVYTEIGSATDSATYRTGRTFVERQISIGLATAYTLPAGHQLELKVEAPSTGSQADMMVAHDTTTCPSYLRLR